MSDEPTVITITDYDEAKEVYRQKELRQALYDAGEVVMADVLVNLHGAEHRDRRRLENRLFRRETFELYERDLFPPIIEATLAPDIEAGRSELVDLGHRMMMNLAALTAGVDRPLGTIEETRRLYRYLMTFIEGRHAGALHRRPGREAKRGGRRTASVRRGVRHTRRSNAVPRCWPQATTCRRTCCRSCSPTKMRCIFRTT